MHFRFDKAGAIGHLICEGEMTASNADCVREALMTSLNNSDFVVVDFTRVKSLDPYCLRLLCVACDASMKLGKHLMMTGIKNGVFKPALNDPEIKRIFRRNEKKCCGAGSAGLKAVCELKGIFSPTIPNSEQGKSLRPGPVLLQDRG